MTYNGVAPQHDSAEPEVIERPDLVARLVALLAETTTLAARAFGEFAQACADLANTADDGVGGHSLAVSAPTQGVIAPQQPYGLEARFDGKIPARQQTSSNERLTR